MSRRFAVFAAVSVVPTAVDIGLLVLFRQRYGLPLIVADLAAIAVASVVSYALHRVATFRSNPYFRWVRYPTVFVAIASVAAIVDAAVLRLAFTAAGYTTVGGLLVAKAVSLSLAVLTRAAGYRYVLSDVVRGERTRPVEPRPLVDGSWRFTVVVPAYREPSRIGTTVARIHEELADVAASGGLEVIVVDDGSADGTADAALAAGAEQVISLPENRGKGAAVRAGVSASRGRVVAFTDADLAYDPQHLRTILESVESGWDVVIGNRRHPESQVARASGVRALGSRGVNRLSAAVLLAAPLDTQCGLKGFRGDVARAVFAHTRIDGFAFDIEVLHLVERGEWSLREIPVRLDESGASTTVDLVADVLRLVVDLARVRRWSSLGAYDDLAATPDALSSAPADPTRGVVERVLHRLQRLRDVGWDHRRLALWISSAVFVAATLAALGNLPPVEGGVDWLPLVLVGAVLVPVGTLANAGEYAVTVAASGGRVGLRPAIRVALMASAANLLPIPGAVLVRVQAMRTIGVPYGRAAGMTGVVGLGFVGVAVLCVGGLQLTTGDAGVVGVGLAAGGLACLAVVAHALRSNPRPGRLFGGLVTVELVSMTIKTFRLLAVLTALRADAGLREASALALALVISLVIGVFPSGLGIREVLTGVLAPTVGLDPSLGVVVAAVDRVVGLSALAALSGLAMVFLRDAVPTEEPAQDAEGR